MTKTIEIMGGNLDLAIEELGVNATRVLETSNEEQYWITYQVWELEESELKKLNTEEWKSEYGWWRRGEAQNGINKKFIVNGKEMIGHYNEDSFYETGYDDETDEEFKLKPDEKIHEFNNFGHYFDEYMGLSTEYNYVYFSTLFAKLNNMKLSEFIKTYY